MYTLRLPIVLLVIFSVFLTAGCGSSGQTSSGSNLGGPAVTEIVYTITLDGNSTHAYSVNSTTAKLHEQPGSPFNLAAVDSSQGDPPMITGATPDGTLLLIQKKRPWIATSSIYVARADANGIPIFPATDSRDYGQPELESMMSPSGKFVYVHEYDAMNSIRTYALDANGKLTETDSIELGPNWAAYSLAPAFQTITADDTTMVVRQDTVSLPRCGHSDFYRLPIDQQTGVPTLPTTPVWGTGSCLFGPGILGSSSFSELLAVDTTDVSDNDPQVLPVMKAYPFDGAKYTATATCDSAVNAICGSSMFKVPPRSSFVVIADKSGKWHSLDKSLKDTGHTIPLPTSGCLDFTPDGRLMLLISNDQHFVCAGNIYAAFFDPAAGKFGTVTGTIPGGGFNRWSSVSVQK